MRTARRVTPTLTFHHWRRQSDLSACVTWPKDVSIPSDGVTWCMQVGRQFKGRRSAHAHTQCMHAKPLYLSGAIFSRRSTDHCRLFIRRQPAVCQRPAAGLLHRRGCSLVVTLMLCLVLLGRPSVHCPAGGRAGEMRLRGTRSFFSGRWSFRSTRRWRWWWCFQPDQRCRGFSRWTATAICRLSISLGWDRLTVMRGRGTVWHAVHCRRLIRLPSLLRNEIL